MQRVRTGCALHRIPSADEDRWTACTENARDQVAVRIGLLIAACAVGMEKVRRAGAHRGLNQTVRDTTILADTHTYDMGGWRPTGGAHRGRRWLRSTACSWTQ